MTNALHEKALGLAKTYKTSEQALLGVLMEMQEKNLFLLLGYKHLFHYVEVGLALGESQAGYFHRVALTSRKVPELKAAVTSGELTLSQARRIAPVITPETAPLWIENAKTMKQKDLEREVTKVNPKALKKEKVVPLTPERTKVVVAVGRETEDALKRAQDLLSQKLGRHASLEDTLGALTKCFLEKHDPVKKAERASSRKVKQTTVNASSRKPSSRSANGRIPAASLHAVNRRLDGRCAHTDSRGNRCTERKWIHVHHILPRAQGGTHHPDNLTLLCSAHHRMHHLEEREIFLRKPGPARAMRP